MVWQHVGSFSPLCSEIGGRRISPDFLMLQSPCANACAGTFAESGTKSAVWLAIKRIMDIFVIQISRVRNTTFINSNTMKISIITALVSLAAFVSCSVSPVPQAVIFDTDMGNDVDDALALAMLHRYADEGRVKLLGVMINKNEPTSAEYIDMVDTYYGYGGVPIAVAERPADSSADGRNADGQNFVEAVVSKFDFPRSVEDYSSLPAAVSLYRQLLAGQPDHSVTIISTGFSTNLAALLVSPADDISPLDGRELLSNKVKLISVMAGNFREEGQDKFPEYNVVRDIPSARKFFAECPVPVAVSPFELGWEICYPASLIESNLGYDAPNPVVEAYKLYLPMPYNRPTWDLTSVLYAVEGSKYFTGQATGTVTIDSEGFSAFTPSADGLHTLLYVSPEARQGLLDRLVELTTK